MNGLGYVPICSSSAASKTCNNSSSRDYCAYFQALTRKFSPL